VLALPYGGYLLQRSEGAEGDDGQHSMRPKGFAKVGWGMATNIYVGNLPWSTTTEDLYALFQQYGVVSRAQVIIDRETGRSRGFGFVEMPNEEEAQAAIAALNEYPLNGRPLTVNVARPRDTSSGGAPRGTYRRGGGYGERQGGGGQNYGRERY